MAAFIAPLIQAGGGIISNLIGGNAAKKAAAQQRGDALNAASGVNAAAKSTEENIAGQVKNAQQGISTAVGQGQQAEGTAVSQGQLGLQTAAGQANQGISDTTERIQQNLNPYTSAGATSVGSLQQMAGANGPLAKQFGFDPSNLSSDPGYNFTLQQGQQAIQRAAAAQGGLFSTGTMKSLAGYTTGSANQYFNDAYNRALSTFNTNRQGALSQISTLQGLAGLGYNATAGGNTALLTGGLAQGQNTTGAAAGSANLGFEGAVDASNLGYSGAAKAGDVGIQGGEYSGDVANKAALESGNFITGASNATANGTLAQGRAQQGIVGTVADMLSQFAKNKAAGSGQGGNSGVGGTVFQS